MQNTSDGLILSIAGFIIVTLLSIIGFGVKKMLTGIYKKIDSMTIQLNDINVKSELMRSEMNKINLNANHKFLEIEKKVNNVCEKQEKMDDEIIVVKEDIKHIKKLHYKHHPEDNIKI